MGLSGKSGTSGTGVFPSRPRRGSSAAASATLLAVTIGLLASAGCQQARPEVTRKLIRHQAMIDFSGLKSVEAVEPLKVSCAAPRQWTTGPLSKTAVYTHQQWKSPSTHTGFGVAMIRLPLPLGQRAVMWFAKREYTKKANDGKLIGEWTDDVGRSWFEAENDKYHVRGFVVTHGFSAWIVYFGHKIAYPPDPAEITLAARAAETVVPLPDMKPAGTGVAGGGKNRNGPTESAAAQSDATDAGGATAGPSGG